MIGTLKQRHQYIHNRILSNSQPSKAPNTQAPPNKAIDPEPLTHPKQEQYTRPHAGSGGGTLELTPSLVKLREETNKKRRDEKYGQPETIKRSPPPGHHIIGGEKARPMTVHAPRHKDMDPNHPQNLQKMKPKTDEYKPYPPPECESLYHLTNQISQVNGKNAPFLHSRNY